MYGLKEEEEEGSEQQYGSVTFTGRLGETMTESLEVVKCAVFNYIQRHNLNDKFDKE